MGREFGYKHTKNTKKKLSLAKIGNKNPNFGKHLSEITKKRLSNALIGKKVSDKTKKYLSKLAKKRIGKLSSMFGRHQSEEAKRKIGLANSKKKHPKGNKHYNWMGGISFNPYPVNWTETLKRSIRERDKYTCQICSLQQEEIAHPVHHIDYNKNNCCPENLITLCPKCHMRTNYNRSEWIKYFKQKNGTISK